MIKNLKIGISDTILMDLYGGGQIMAFNLYLGLKRTYNCIPINLNQNGKILNPPFSKFYTRSNKIAKRFIRYFVRRDKFMNFFSSILIKKLEPLDVLISNAGTDYLLKNKLSYDNLIVIKHGSFDLSTKDGLQFLARSNFLISKAKDYRVIALNKKDYIDLSRTYKDKAVLIHNGVKYKNTEQIPDISKIISQKINNKSLILYLGRLEESQKKVSELIFSARDIKNKNFIIIIAGEGPDKEKYIKLTYSLGLQDKIIFTGFVPENLKVALYKSADIFVSPSKNESFGLTTLEAMHYGDIVLTTRNNGSEEIINDKINGFFIESNHNDISSKINYIMSLKKSKLINIKRNAIKKSNYFSYEKMILSYIKTIKSFYLQN